MNLLLSRRGLIRRSVGGAVGFLGLRTALENRVSAQSTSGFGPLVADPDGLLDLPRGFKYRAFSRTGDLMTDGYRVPGLHDGMAAFPGPNGSTLLVRNHENQVLNPGASVSPYVNTGSLDATNVSLIYDRASAGPASGGTTNLLFNTRTMELESQFLSLTGTIRNCAGGPTPWGSWLTCEETTLRTGQASGGSTLARHHGYVFEVRAIPQVGIQSPVPLKALGRYSHEALALHPSNGIVYLTEDQGNSVFYRFVPEPLVTPPTGNLTNGKLQALRFRNRGLQDARNYNGPVIPVGTQFEVEWFDLTDTDPQTTDDLRTRAAAQGAAIFSREEGCWWGNGLIYFACTDGGQPRLGQIFKYTPSAFEGTAGEANSPAFLELFIEPVSEAQFAAPDNICIAPSGDIIVCEDGGGIEYVHGVTQSGSVYKIARNALNDSEFAGACWSPDGSTLFVNVQTPGITFAIAGPWHRRVA